MNSSASERAGARRYTRARSSLTARARAPAGRRAPRRRDPRRRSAGTAAGCPRRARSPSRSRCGSRPDVGLELGQPIGSGGPARRRPEREADQVGEPQRDELTARDRARRSRPAAATRRIRSVHSVSIRLRSLRGYSSSSAAARASSSARVASPRARTDRSNSAHGCDAADLAGKRRPGEPLGAGPQRGAVRRSRARARARASPERQPRARVGGLRSCTPSPRARPRLVEPPGASKRTSWQRERIVGSTSTSRSVSRIRWTNDGRLLERLQHPVGGLVAELVDPLDHEHAPARLERRLARRGDHRPVDVADEDLVRAARARPRSGRDASPTSTRARAPSGSAAPVGQQLGGQRPRRRALAGAARPVEQVRVRGPAARARAPARARRGRGDGDPSSTARLRC